MQQGKLKLKEVIWEITSECNNNCSYCGSKEVAKIKTSDEMIINIAKEIAKFPPEQIDISGGDPLIPSLETHQEIVKILKEKSVMVKILANPKSLGRNMFVDEKLLLYDWIGISINTIEELDLFKSYLGESRDSINYPMDYMKNVTIITNFNLSNFFIYNTIEEFVQLNRYNWMVQYTIYKDENNPLAIYNNDAANAELSSKIKISLKNSVKVIISDNANNSLCSAGINSIGILYDGTVVPCLSMRAWGDVKEYQNRDGRYNILKRDLANIWIAEFTKQRFGCFECCKDVCKNKLLTDLEFTIKEVRYEGYELLPGDIKKIIEEKGLPLKPQRPITILYGVVPGNTFVYGVVSDNDIYKDFSSTATTGEYKNPDDEDLPF